MVARILVALALLAATARADSPKLAQARQAIEAVRYDEAERLLAEALRDGGNSPSAVAEIYKLSADTAVVLDRKGLAEQYFRRWLALDPKASLPPDVAPKIRQPFIEAQAYMNAHGRLAAKVARAAATVDIVVETDPLGMAVAASLDGGPRVPLDTERRAHLPANTGAVAAIHDEHGNRLVELAVPPPATTAPPPPPRKPVGLPFYRRARPWTIAGAVSLGAAVITGFLAGENDAEARLIASTSSDHTLADYNAAIDRRNRYALVANVSYAATGVFLVAAIVARMTRPSGPVVAPTVSRDGAGVALGLSF